MAADNSKTEFTKYVAIGDSFTEGVGDPDPAGDRFRGWADLFAARAAEQWPGLAYANLAVRGRLFDRIVDEQVVPAIKQSPDLVSFAAGGNDALRPGYNPVRLATRAHEVVRLFKASGAEVILFTYTDLGPHIPGISVLRKRFLVMNDHCKKVARRHGAVLVDLWEDRAFDDPRLWSEDRLHLSTLGHQRVAYDVCGALGVEPDPAWCDPLPALPRPRRETNGVQWAGKHLAPWVRRRLTGKSSGDSVTPKRPELTKVKK